MDNQKAFTAAELQIMSANRAYIVLLAETAKYAKYAIYTDSGNGLQVLWAKSLNYDDYNKTQLFKYQVKANDKENYPAYISKCLEIGTEKARNSTRCSEHIILTLK